MPMTPDKAREIAARPLARAVYTLAATRFAGELRAAASSGGAVSIEWARGLIVGAASESDSDEPGRIAAAAEIATEDQVERARARAQSEGVALVDALAEVAELGAERREALARRAVAQAAARAFALDAPALEIRAAGEDTTHAPASSGGAAAGAGRARDVHIDPRWLIARGVLGYCSEAKLARELAFLRGGRLGLSSRADNNIEALRLPSDAAAVARALRGGPVSFDELIADPPGERRRALAVIYTLLATDCLDLELARGEAPGPPAPGTAAASPPRDRPTAGPPRRHATADSPTANPPREAPRRQPISEPPRDPPREPPRRQATADPSDRRGAPAAQTAAPTAPAAASQTADSLRALIEDKRAALERGDDAFALLGLPRGAPAAEVHRAYFALAKKLHPDKIQAAGVERTQASQRVFAALNWAFSTLTDEAARSAYERELEGGGAEDRAATIMAAERHAKRGEAALGNSHFEAAARELEKAAELNPDEGEHRALAAWAQWCVASDKNAAREGVRRRLDEAAELAPKNPKVRYYRGLVAKQSGDARAAAADFRKVLELRPHDRDAARELRLLDEEEARAGRASGGLLSKLRRG